MGVFTYVDNAVSTVLSSRLRAAVYWNTAVLMSFVLLRRSRLRAAACWNIISGIVGLITLSSRLRAAVCWNFFSLRFFRCTLVATFGWLCVETSWNSNSPYRQHRSRLRATVYLSEDKLTSKYKRAVKNMMILGRSCL